MRALLPLIAAAAALAACSTQPNRVMSTPPTVSYRIPGNNVAATNAEAQNYCAQYGHAAQYQGVQAGSGGNVAVYSCDGGATAEGSSLPPVAAPPPAVTPCGVNGYYSGPAPGCPTRP
jgi:hypothetical protein